MLRQLHIRNYALIEELDIPFHPGFSVITGETGAGKSIILGAIGLLLGQRATHLPSLPEGKKCTVEAHFDISNYEMNAFFTDNDIDYDPEDTILRREISSTGKSRMFINDTPVTLSLIRELGEQLIDIHSQHQNLLLNKEDFQLNVIDIMAADGVQLNDYKSTFTAYSQANRQLNELIEEIERNKENEEYLRFQFNELEEAKLVEGEQEELEQMSETMTHSEEIKSTLYDITNSLNGEQNGIVNLLKSSAQQLRHIEKVFPAAEELATRLESTHIEMKDIAQEMEAKLEDIDFNPQQLEALNERLDRIYSLQQRFHVNSVSELLEIHHTIQEQLSHINNSEDELEEKRQQVKDLLAQSTKKAKALTDIRMKAAKLVENELKKRLIPLGIQNVRFQIQISPKPLAQDGANKVSFLFSANKSGDLQPISQIASGGEIARVMLSLKAMISGAVKLPTIIFDEIDTGVSGRVAEQMAQIMHEMGENKRQVISITHLPQIAAMGMNHYKVLKEDTSTATVSKMSLLTYDERVAEIAQMLSGSDISQAALDNARALLKTNKS